MSFVVKRFAQGFAAPRPDKADINRFKTVFCALICCVIVEVGKSDSWNILTVISNKISRLILWQNWITNPKKRELTFLLLPKNCNFKGF